MGKQSRASNRRGEQDLLQAVIREARTEAGLTAKALSVKLQTDPTYVSRVERGMRTIDLVEFTDIATAIGVDPLDLYRRFLLRIPGRA